MRRALLTLLLIFAALHATRAADLTEAALKAAYVYKFATFATWPPDAPAGDLIVGVAADGQTFDQIERVLSGKKVGSRNLSVRRVRGADAAACHLVYVAGNAPHAGILAATREKPVLTIGDADSFSTEGGIIGFKREGTKLRFQINQAAAAKSRVQLSAQLSRLASNG